MNTQNDGWIKMSERKPTEFPVWGAFELSGINSGIKVVSFYDRGILPHPVTHWKPAILPEPPKKELTQRELDEKAHDMWYSGSGLANWNDPTGHIWHAALAYRDKQNAEDLGFVRDMCARIDADALDRLRRRSGLDT